MQTPKKPNFTGLDRKQQGILSAGGWHPGLGVSTPSSRTLQKLLDRGFLELGGLGYSVPADIATAWIAHCAERKANEQTTSELTGEV